MARKKQQQDLIDWGHEKWGTPSGKNSVVGKDPTGEPYLPEAARKSLTPAQLAAQTKNKRKAMKQGKQKAKYTEATAKAVLKGRMKAKSYGKKKSKKGSY